MPTAEAGELQGRPTVPKVTYTVPLQMRTERGRASSDEVSEFLTIEEEGPGTGASGPLLLGSLREMTFAWILMRGHHERRRQRSNRGFAPRYPPPARGHRRPRTGLSNQSRQFFQQTALCLPGNRERTTADADTARGAQHLRDGPNPANQTSTDNQGAQWPTSTTSPN